MSAATCVAKLEETIEADSHSSRIILPDSQGNCYDTGGRHGVWSDLDILTGGEEQYTYISDSFAYEGAYWTFAQRLGAPLHSLSEDVDFTHVVLLKDVRTLAKYYASAAYGSQNETYILKGNGARMNDGATQEKMIQSYNVLNTLEEMGASGIREVFERTDTVSGNFTRDGMEYYYCVTSLETYDTLPLFLIPTEFVAAETVEMVNTVVRTALVPGLINDILDISKIEAGKTTLNFTDESVLQGVGILAAEDNEINAEILGELLGIVGARCEICGNGQKAVEARRDSTS